jgi:hypothetical protein
MGIVKVKLALLVSFMRSYNTVGVLAFSNVKAEYMRQCESSSRTDLTKVSHFEAFLPFNLQ